MIVIVAMVVAVEAKGRGRGRGRVSHRQAGRQAVKHLGKIAD